MGDKKNVKKGASNVDANVEKKQKPKSTKNTQAVTKEVAPKKENKIENKKENIVVGKDLRNQKNVSKNNESGSSVVKIVLGIVLIIFIAVLLFKACNKPKEEYNVTFDTNGGTRIADVVVKEDGKLKEPEEPTREGYIFAGWYYNDELYDFDNPVTKDIKLEAKWVKAVGVTGVELNKASIKLSPDETTTLVATIKPKDASNKSLIWESSNPDVVTVDKNGKVTAIKEGTATITVTTEDGEFTAKAKVTVVSDEDAEEEEVAVTGIRVNKEVVTIKVGKTTKVTAVVLPTNATNKNVTWESSNPSVAKVSSTGVITGVKAGTATITVTTEDGEYTETIIVTVKPIVKADKVTIEGDTMGIVGGTTTLTAIVTPANTDDKTVTWKSSNEDVATVSTQGVVEFVGKGTVTITATTSNGKKATHEITVKEAYTITFKANETDEDALVVYIDVLEGTNIQSLINQLDAPTKEGYKLIGWESLSGVQVNSSTVATSDATYVAMWKSTSIEVKDQTELENALADDYETIIIAESFEVDKSIVIPRDVEIVGKTGEEEITLSDDSTEHYIFKVYGNNVAPNSIDVSFENIKLTSADAAILVGDYTNVTVTDLDVTGNAWGGIEVKDIDRDGNAAVDVVLNVESIANDSEVNGNPTIWVDNDNIENAVINFGDNAELYERKQVGQVHYYLEEENTKTSTEVKNQTELENALLNDFDIIVIAESFEVDKSIVISRDVEIVGKTGEEEITLADSSTEHYIFKVYGNNVAPNSIDVSFENIKLTSADAAILVGDYTNVTVTDLDVTGNAWGGIEVKDIDRDGNAAVDVVLTVVSITNDSEVSKKPTVWVDHEIVENAKVNYQGAIETPVTGQVHYYAKAENAIAFVDSEVQLLAAIANSDISIIELTNSVAVSEALVINRNLEINGNSYSITADTDFALNGAKGLVVLSGDVEVTLDGVTLDASSKATAIYSSAKNLVLNNSTVTGGHDSFGAGVYITGKGNIEITNSTISGNTNGTYKGVDRTNDGYLQYSSDLWIGSEATGTINSGEIINVFVNDNEYGNGGTLTVKGGEITDIYLEYEDGAYATLNYTGGTIDNLHISTTTGNGTKVTQINPAEDTYKSGVIATEAELLAAIADSNVSTIELASNIAVSEALVINRNLEIIGNNYSITADTDFALNGAKGLVVLSGDVEVTLDGVTLDASSKATAIYSSAKNLVLNNSTVTGGHDSFGAGVYITGKGNIEITNSTISGNTNGTYKGVDRTNDGYLQYSSDLWIGSEATGTINSGEITNVFVNDNEYGNGGTLTVKGGEITDIYLEYEDGAYATLNYTSGTIDNLHISTTTGNGNATTISTPSTDTYKSGKVTTESHLVTLLNDSSVTEIVLSDDVTITSGLQINRNVTIKGNGNSIEAGEDFALNGAKGLVVLSGDVEVTLDGVTLDASSKATAIYSSAANLVLNNSTVTGGHDSFGAGVYITGKGNIEITNSTISGNTNGTYKGVDRTNDEYLQYSSDLWIGSQATGTINSGTIDNVFVNDNEYGNGGTLTVKGGEIKNIYLEYEDGAYATLVYSAGTVNNLYVSTTAGNGDSNLISNPTTDTYKSGQ